MARKVFRAGLEAACGGPQIPHPLGHGVFILHAPGLVFPHPESLPKQSFVLIQFGLIFRQFKQSKTSSFSKSGPGEREAWDEGSYQGAGKEREGRRGERRWSPSALGNLEVPRAGGKLSGTH